MRFGDMFSWEICQVSKHQDNSLNTSDIVSVMEEGYFGDDFKICDFAK